MKSIRFETCGEPADVLRCEEREIPTPGSGEVRVRMLASPVNPSDLMYIRGVYGKKPSLPATPGFEGVGVVEASGGGLLGKLLVGKRVAVLNRATGNWSEQTTVPARQAIPLSSQIPVEQAACFFVNPTTAYVMTHDYLKVGRGQWLLQTAAGSQLGRMVIRLGQRFGFRTLNVVRSDAHADELRRLGADEVLVIPTDEIVDRLPAEVERITGGAGVPFALDPVAGVTGSTLVRCLGDGGRLLVYGTLTGEPLPFPSRELMTRRASVEGFWLSWWMDRLSLLGKVMLLRKVGKLIREGTLTSEVGPTFGLEGIAEAVRAAEQPGLGSKVVLKIGEP